MTTQNIQTSTFALISLANNIHKNKRFPTSENIDSFFEEYSQSCLKNEATSIVVDLDDKIEYQFDPDYFIVPQAISAFLSHEFASYIFLCTRSSVGVFVIDHNVETFYLLN